MKLALRLFLGAIRFLICLGVGSAMLINNYYLHSDENDDVYFGWPINIPEKSKLLGFGVLANFMLCLALLAMILFSLQKLCGDLVERKVSARFRLSTLLLCAFVAGLFIWANLTPHNSSAFPYEPRTFGWPWPVQRAANAYPSAPEAGEIYLVGLGLDAVFMFSAVYFFGYVVERFHARWSKA